MGGLGKRPPLGIYNRKVFNMKDIVSKEDSSREC